MRKYQSQSKRSKIVEILLLKQLSIRKRSNACCLFKLPLILDHSFAKKWLDSTNIHTIAQALTKHHCMT